MSSKAVEVKKIEKPTKRLAVVRIRGRVGVRKPIVETLNFLRLFRKFHLVLVDNRMSYRGMLQKAKDYIAFGEVRAETIALLLKKRGRLTGNIPLTDAYIKKYTQYKTIDEFATAIENFNAELTYLRKLKPVFRLHPPKGGFKGKTKRPVKDHGELGYRGIKIKDLINKMV
ncbi:MAG: 50S ribosomal protein L30 [Promethearchaeota archaeon]